MRRYLFILLLFLCSTSYSQDVAKERLVSWSQYQNGLFFDSAQIHYPNRNSGYIGDYKSFYNWNLYWTAQYDSITNYHSSTKSLHTRYFDRNKSSGQMTAQLFMRNDSIPKNHYATKEKIWVDKKNNNVIRYDIYGYSNEPNNLSREVVLNSSHTRYDKNDNRILDSVINFWDGRPSSYQATKSSYYDNNQRQQTISFCANSLDSNIGKHEIRNYNKTGQLIRLESFVSTYSNQIEDYEIKNYWFDEKERTILQVETTKINEILDTLVFREYKYIDSVLLNENIETETSYIRTHKDSNYVLQGRIEYKYSNNKLIKRSHYSWDSLSWKPGIVFEYKYNSSDKLIELLYWFPKKRTTTIPSTARKNNWTYNDRGNLTSHIVSEAYHYSDTFYNSIENYYYYQPYLEKTTDLNYTQLVPISYPNPFESSINILFSCVPNKEGQLRIMNLQGKIIATHNFSSPNEIYQYQWDAYRQASGLYFAYIVMGKEKQTIKLHKSK